MDVRKSVDKGTYVQALFKLCETKSINKITVSDLLHETGTARQTFYNNFRDINSLISYVFNYHFDDNYNIFNTREGSFESLQFIRDHKSFFCQLPKHVGQNNFRETHIEKLKRGYYKLVFQSDDPSPEDFRKALIDLYVEGCVGVMFSWLESGLTDPSDEAIVNAYWEAKPDFIPPVVLPCLMPEE